MEDYVPDQEGLSPYRIPALDKQLETHYKVFGDLDSGQPPLIVLHGGPGSAHEYMLPFAQLWIRNRIPVILYDQLGCAGSTRLKEKKHDKSFWTVDPFVRELDSLVAFFKLDNEAGGPGYHLLGHSWGGLLAAHFASRRPPGLRKLALANAPASFDLHSFCLKLLVVKLPADAQQAYQEAVTARDYKGKSYKKYQDALLRTFWCRSDPFPPKLLEPRMAHQQEDQTVQIALFGETAVECSGSLFGWDCFAELPNIKAKTLCYHGEYDFEREEAVAPFLAFIPDTRYVKIASASHMSHLDSPQLEDEVLKLVGGFLAE